jgi:aspartate racemase
LQEKGFIKSNMDYPQIVINSIPAPELIYDNISDDDLKLYITGLGELDKLEVDFIVMVCNTIHLFYDDLQKEIKTPILDLRKELRKRLVKSNIKTVTILGTPCTIKKGLYKFEKIKYLNPSSRDMKQLTDIIFNFNKGFEKERQIAKVKKICQKYLQKGSEIIILGCTEFTIMLKGENLPTIDTIDILVESTVNKLTRMAKNNI